MKTFSLLLRYWSLIREVLEFLDIAFKATADGKVSNAERSELMKAFWEIIDLAKVSQASR
jgi:hypothetical protein